MSVTCCAGAVDANDTTVPIMSADSVVLNIVYLPSSRSISGDGRFLDKCSVRDCRPGAGPVPLGLQSSNSKREFVADKPKSPPIRPFRSAVYKETHVGRVYSPERGGENCDAEEQMHPHRPLRGGGAGRGARVVADAGERRAEDQFRLARVPEGARRFGA